jgi:nicotinate-nucleotide pyrophosphorylase (carboxylating)
MDEKLLQNMVRLALAEDVGTGDVTSAYFVPEVQKARARIFAKEPIVLAGLAVLLEVFRQADSEVTVTPRADDGDRLAAGDTIVEINGRTRSLLRAERLALNFLQQMSGVATLTRQFVDAVAGTRAQVLDTRKTLPGLRLFQKEAVLAGGGQNHRMGLYDRVMVKDNHLLSNSSLRYLQDCIDRVRTDIPEICVELEADSLEQVRSFLELRGVDVILLDNMSTGRMREAVELGAGRVKFEASGGVTLKTVGAIARTGVDYISIGALTHSAPAVDLSMEITEVLG